MNFTGLEAELFKQKTIFNTKDTKGTKETLQIADWGFWNAELGQLRICGFMSLTPTDARGREARN